MVLKNIAPARSDLCQQCHIFFGFSFDTFGEGVGPKGQKVKANEKRLDVKKKTSMKKSARREGRGGGY